MTLLDSLSPSARLAYPVIVSGVRRGLSMSAIGDLVRSHDIHIANDTLRALIRQERAVWEAAPRLQFLNRGARPDPNRLPEALTAIQRQFSFTVRVLGRPTAGGDVREQFVTISTDQLLTRGEMEEMAQQAVTGGGERYGMTVESSTLQSGVRAGAKGIL